VLRSQKFDLIVVSRVRDSDLHQIINLSDGAEVLILEEMTMPSELLSLVAERLDRHEQRAQPSRGYEPRIKRWLIRLRSLCSNPERKSRSPPITPFPRQME
jgi:hypothetical protein